MRVLVPWRVANAHSGGGALGTRFAAPLPQHVRLMFCCAGRPGQTCRSIAQCCVAATTLCLMLQPCRTLHSAGGGLQARVLLPVRPTPVQHSGASPDAVAHACLCVPKEGQWGQRGAALGQQLVLTLLPYGVPVAVWPCEGSERRPRPTAPLQPTFHATASPPCACRSNRCRSAPSAARPSMASAPASVHGTHDAPILILALWPSPGLATKASAESASADVGVLFGQRLTARLCLFF